MPNSYTVCYIQPKRLGCLNRQNWKKAYIVYTSKKEKWKKLVMDVEFNEKKKLWILTNKNLARIDFKFTTKISIHILI